MSVELNHTIVLAADKEVTAKHLTSLLGLPDHTTFGPFAVVTLANGVSLDVADDHGRPHLQHYAFLVGDAEFDEIMARIGQRGLAHWADPFRKLPGQINTDDGGRGVYWEEPSGHLLEAITRPYGSGG